MANRIAIDLDPLRHSRGFRLLVATQLTMVAIAFEVYAVTRSSLQVGAVSVAQLVPLIAGALIGGSVGDAFDRRRILMMASPVLAVTAGALAFNAALAHPSVVAIYLVAAAAAALGGVVSTVCNAAVPALVEARHLVAAYSCMQVVDQVAMVVAPAASGLLIGAAGLQWVYVLVTAGYVLATVTAVRMSPVPQSPGPPRPGLRSVVEGLRYLRGRQVVQGVYLIDINAMVFGLPRALFPALALSVFHGGASTLGCLYAAPAAGALLGALTTGWLGRVRRQGWVVIVSVGVWGAVTVVFGLVHVLWIALVLLAAAGWADVISAVLRTTILQASVPEALRNRISGLQIAVVEGGPRLGDLESGAVASLVSTEFSIVSGGLACIAGAVLLAGLLPGFRRHRLRSGQPDSPPATSPAVGDGA